MMRMTPYLQPASTVFEVGRRYGARGYEIIVTARTAVAIEVERSEGMPRRLFCAAPDGIEAVRPWADVPARPLITALDRLPAES